MANTTTSTKCLYCSKHPRAGKVCSECQDEERRAEKFKPVVQAFIDNFPVPEGFVKTTGEGWHNGMEHVTNPSFYQDTPWFRNQRFVMIENVEAGIRIACCVSNGPEMYAPWQGKKKAPARPVLSASGHTCYKSEKGFWLTFDRRGVDDSFYLGAYGDADIQKIIPEQLARIASAKETSKKMVDIPGFGFRIHQDKLEETRQRIQRGGTQTFTPSGFGTGHRLSIRRSRYSKPMPQETAAFFGVTALYDETFDHD